MRAALVVLVVLELGCTKGPKGDPGATGPTGPASSAKRLVWVDATGAEVGPAQGPRPTYVDDKGNFWPVDQETGKATAPEPTASVLFDNSNCSGTAYVGLTTPRVVFKAIGDDTLRVRPDGLQATAVASLYAVGGSGCYAPGGGGAVVPLEPTAPVPALQVPSLAFAPPLHQELR